MINQFKLTNQSAIVTGGGGGIGSSLAEALYDAGAKVALVDNSESVKQVAEKIRKTERPVYTIQTDLRDRQELVQCISTATERLEGIDILVNCHGAVYAKDSIDHDLDSWDDTLEVNLTSVFELCQLAGRLMIKQGKGKIINIASMLSFSGGLKAPAYAASKGGVAQLTKALANEWAPLGVNVNAIAPGYVRTLMNAHIWQDPIRNEQILARLPAARWADPSDLKGAVVFLASSASDYLHGVILPVDGGFLSR